MTQRIRATLRGAALLAFLVGGATAPAQAQTTADECDDMVSQYTQAYLTNVYDDLSRLREAVPALVSSLRQDQPLTEAQLSQMTTEQIKNNQELIQRQRDCLPRLIDLIRQIKNRIEQLEGLANTGVQQNRRGTERGRLIDDVLEGQEDLRDAVDAALRRAGIG